MALDNLLQKVLKDEVFLRASGGGVTLSKGEALIRARFAARFLQCLRQWGTCTATEIAGDGTFDRSLPVIKVCNEVLFDFKIMEPERA